MTTNIVVVSLFDGLSSGRLALQPIPHLNVLRYYSSEIKPYALSTASKNFPQDDPHRLGDITAINGTALKEVIKRTYGDVKILLIGGSPCQDFSQANKERLGDQGKKSGLFYEYVRIKEELSPDFFLLENVRMKREHQDLVSSLMGTEPIVINSEAVSPQLRHRLYWTNVPNIGPIEREDVTLNSILTSGYSDREKARTLLESDSRPLATPLKMAHRYFNTGFTTLIFKNENHYNQLKSHFDAHFRGKSAKEIDTISQGLDPTIYDGLRYMNPQERASCQTVPHDYCSGLTPNQIACLLGDGWTIKVITHILKGIE